MLFYNLNKWFWDLPDAFHHVTFAVLVGLYAHLIFGFFMIRKRLKPHVIKYFFLRTGILFFLLFLKSDDDTLGMLDLFLPVWLITYIDGLIILNGFGFHRCQNLTGAVKRIFQFRIPKDNPMSSEKLSPDSKNL